MQLSVRMTSPQQMVNGRSRRVAPFVGALLADLGEALALLAFLAMIWLWAGALASWV
jgi:Na+-transporting NADH:ubiquinone oxidoreductase subunit NqrB